MTEARPHKPSLGVAAQAEFCQVLLEHLRAGLPVAEGLASLARGARSGRLRRAAARLRDGVGRGLSLGDAMSEAAGRSFPAAFVALVRASERTGALADVLDCCLREVYRQERLRGTVRRVVLYPLLSIWASLVFLVVVEVGAIPSLVGVYAEMRCVTLLLTDWMIGFSGLLHRFWGHFLALAGLFLVLQVRFLLRSDFGGPTWRVLRFAPPFRAYFRSMDSATFLGTAGALLRHGVALPDALGCAGASLLGANARRDVRHAQEVAIGGATPEQASWFFLFVPDEAREILHPAQPATAPSRAMEDLADYYDRRLQSPELGLLSLVGPASFFLAAGSFTILVAAIVLPFFNTYVCSGM